MSTTPVKDDHVVSPVKDDHVVLETPTSPFFHHIACPELLDPCAVKRSAGDTTLRLSGLPTRTTLV